MASSKRILNVEVGDRITKVCLSTPKGKTCVIRSSFMFQTPENAVTDGLINSPEALSGALRAQLVTHGLTDVKTVIFVLTSGKVASREVKLPPVNESRLKGLVELNTSEYFPVDMSKYHVTYSLLDRVDKGEDPGCRVLVYAAPLNVLESYFKTAELAQLSVQAIDFSVNSQYQALRSIGGESASMYVNVDCNNSNVLFMKGGKLLLQRAFAFGGDDLVLGYMNAAGKKTGDYVSALTECSSGDPDFLSSEVMSSVDVDDSLARVVSSVARSMDYYNTNHWENQVEKVVLMGPCSHLAGLNTAIASATGLETVYLDELPGMSGFANEIESASLYISCIGSTLAPIDLVPPQFKQDKKSKKKYKQKKDSISGGVLICAVCLIAAGAMGFFSMQGYNEAVAEKQRTEAEIAALEYTRDVYDAYMIYDASAKSFQTVGAEIGSWNDELSAFFTELETKMPTGIILLSASCGSTGVSMNVTVPSFEAAAVTIVQLRDFESIADVQVGGLVRSTDETGGDYVSFSISCVYAPYGTETPDETQGG